MLKVGSLFSGIGGLEYGLERTGAFKTIWQSEWEDVEYYCIECGGYLADNELAMNEILSGKKKAKKIKGRVNTSTVSKSKVKQHG